MTIRSSVSRLALSLAVASFAAFAAPTQLRAAPGDLLLILSDQYAAPDAKTIMPQIGNLASTLKDGQRLVVLSGPGQREIATLEMPTGDDAAFLRQYPRRMTEFLSPLVQGVVAHLKASVERSASGPAELDSQLDLPDMMATLDMFVEGGETVILFGSGQYYDPRYADFSTLAAYPDAAHARFTPAQTPFGGAGVAALPEGVTFHFCDMAPEYLSRSHQDGVRDVWLQLVDAYGGRVATFMNLTDRCVVRAVAATDEGAPEVPKTPDTGDRIMWRPDQTPPVSVPAVDDPDTALGPTVADVDGLDPGAQARLEDLVNAGTVTLMRIAFYDTAEQDGDIIEILAGSGANKVHVRVPILHKPTWFTVPVTAAGLRILAVDEGGGGGVTLGLKTADGFVDKTPRIDVGKSITMALR